VLSLSWLLLSLVLMLLVVVALVLGKDIVMESKKGDPSMNVVLPDKG